MSLLTIADGFLVWKDPIKTGSVFAGLNLLAFVVLFCSPVLTLTYLGMVLIVIGALLNALKPDLVNGVPDELVTTEQISAVATFSADTINAIFAEGKRLFFWQDYMTTCYALMAMYVLKIITPFFSLTTLLILALEGLFLLPVGWEKAQVGEKVMPHVEDMKKKAALAWEKIPRASHVKKD
jgi:hypothetical protein